ncbi:MAG: hypothetical protein WCY74_00905 [Sphaerochaetaceae bacterium]|nr:hypothetical protein [Sphaerochaetaceae bacterium]MDD3941658.1 hypothetical protein [Sphaerochaetaceae bacterium]MDX9939519.1 hypothetical protein [Sphaerochaetaceae bacterium]
MSSTFHFYDPDISDLQFDASSLVRMYGIQFGFHTHGNNVPDLVFRDMSISRWYGRSVSDSNTGLQSKDSLIGISVLGRYHGIDIIGGLFGAGMRDLETAFDSTGRFQETLLQAAGLQILALNQTKPPGEKEVKPRGNKKEVMKSQLNGVH